MKSTHLLGAAILGLSFAIPAQSVEVEPAMSEKHANAYTEYRQSVFTLLKSNIGPLGAMAKGKIEYDTDLMQTNAMRMEQLAGMLSDYLRVDTSNYDLDSDAKASIWQNFDDVQSKITDLKQAAANLQNVAQSGDESKFRQAIGNVGSTCKSCHDDYKKD